LSLLALCMAMRACIAASGSVTIASPSLDQLFSIKETIPL
jgi:hypothetical protein